MCDACLSTIHIRGPKWRLVREVFYSGTLDATWLRHTYDSVMIADDDLAMAGTDIALAFRTMYDRRLALAQLSLCPKSYSWWDIVRQNATTALRYTNFCELMAPIIDTNVFVEVVLDTLIDAHLGWGLDFVWPSLLGYPNDSIAIIDDACMMHKGRIQNATGSLYATPSPYTPYVRWLDATWRLCFDLYSPLCDCRYLMPAHHL